MLCSPSDSMLAVRGGARSLRRGLASTSSARQANLLCARGYSKASAPPPAGQPATPGPEAAPQGGPGLGVGGMLGVLTVAGVVGYNGYYYVFASKEEQKQMDAQIEEVRSTLTTYVYNPIFDKEATQKEMLKRAVEKVEVMQAAKRKAEASAPEARVPPEEPKGASKAAAVVQEVAEAALEEEAVAELEETAAMHKTQSVASKVEEKREEAPAKPEPPVAAAPAPASAPVAAKGKSSVQVIADRAAGELSHYQERAKAIRVDTLNRAAEEALAEGNALAKHLESSLLKDLNKLDADALKLRIIQLTGEMQERTKWEALRLHETVRKAEEELSAKYTSLVDALHKDNLDALGRQARALETEKELALTALAEAKEAELRRRLDDEMDSFKKAALEKFQEQRSSELKKLEAKLRGELEDRFWQHEEKAKEDTAARIKELQDIKGVVEALEKAVVDERGYEAHSYKVHKLTAALLALEQKLSTSEPLFKELQALKKVTQGDDVLQSALSSLPSSVGDGVPTVSELQVRFPKVMASTREASFVPEDSTGLVGHMLGSVLATITIKPKGLVDGAGTDETLSRASYYVERGDLNSAVKELGTLQGLPAKTVKDWVADAEARLLVEQAITVMNSRSALLNLSLV